MITTEDIKKITQNLQKRNRVPIACVNYDSKLIVFAKTNNGIMVDEYWSYKNEKIEEWYPQDLLKFIQDTNGKIIPFNPKYGTNKKMIPSKTISN